MAIRFTSPATRSSLSHAVSRGTLRRVVQGVYTDDLTSPIGDVVATHRWEIIGHFIPDGVIVDRSAAVGGAPSEGVIHIASMARSTDLVLPGLTVAVRRGPHLGSDLPWSAGLWIASPARTLVDNLAISRGRGRRARTLDSVELGDWVARQAMIHGPQRLNRIRDDARAIAAELGVEDRIAGVDRLISAVLGSRSVEATRRRSRALVALAGGSGFDQARVGMFEQVSGLLSGFDFDDEVPGSLIDEHPEVSSLGFWEAYFSNYIEGTVFEVDEAQRIVRTGVPPTSRPADGHDVLGTYRVVSDPDQRSRVAEEAEQFLTLLRQFNAEILVGRPEMHPGEWKTIANQASGYRFVDPGLVEGTLVEGYAFRDRLANPFARAAFMFFLVSEVHPFSDGNGRVARAVMNAELTAAGQGRIVIPIVWRNEYLTAVRELSRSQRVELFLRTMAVPWRWTAAMDWTDPPTTDALMAQTHALLDSTEAASRGLRLRIPGA